MDSLNHNSKYKTIGEVAKILDLMNKKNGLPSTHTIRFWEKEFKQIKPKIFYGKRRYYDENAINLLAFLKSKIDDNLKIKNLKILEGKVIYKLFAGPYQEEKIAKVSAEKLLELGFSTIYKKE